MTRADLKHRGKIPDAREELNRPVRERRIESRHSIKSLEGMGSSSHDLGAELRMHSFTVNCDTFSNEKKNKNFKKTTNKKFGLTVKIVLVKVVYYSKQAFHLLYAKSVTSAEVLIYFSLILHSCIIRYDNIIQSNFILFHIT